MLLLIFRSPDTLNLALAYPSTIISDKIMIEKKDGTYFEPPLVLQHQYVTFSTSQVPVLNWWWTQVISKLGHVAVSFVGICGNLKRIMNLHNVLPE